MNYDMPSLQQANPHSQKVAAAMAQDAQMGAMLGAQMVEDKKPIKVAMEAMERAVSGVEATIAALDARLGLVKRNGGAMEGQSTKEANGISNNSPLAEYMREMTKRTNAVQRRIAEICAAIEL